MSAKRPIKMAALEASYRIAVRSRSHKHIPTRNISINCTSYVRTIADKLEDSRLAELFVEAQFAYMPADWCADKFNTPHPPANVVFGNGSWEKYVEYTEKGIRIPTK